MISSMCGIRHCEHQAPNSQRADQGQFHSELLVRK